MIFQRLLHIFPQSFSTMPARISQDLPAHEPHLRLGRLISRQGSLSTKFGLWSFKVVSACDLAKTPLCCPAQAFQRFCLLQHWSARKCHRWPSFMTCLHFRAGVSCTCQLACCTSFEKFQQSRTHGRYPLSASGLYSFRLLDVSRKATFSIMP